MMFQVLWRRSVPVSASRSSSPAPATVRWVESGHFTEIHSVKALLHHRYQPAFNKGDSITAVWAAVRRPEGFTVTVAHEHTLILSLHCPQWPLVVSTTLKQR